MFIGHYGVALAAKSIEPSLPLAGLMLSTQAMDVVWSSLIMAGIEKMRLVPGFTKTNDLDLYYIPFSHGLLTSLGWSVGVAAVVNALLPGLEPIALLVIGAVCWSHWWLDLLVHPRDLPLVGNGYKVGLGLWNHKWATLILELALLFGGALLYMASLPAGGGMRWFVGGLSLALAALHCLSVFGPPPTSAKGYAAQAFVAYLVVAAMCYGAERTWVG